MKLNLMRSVTGFVAKEEYTRFGRFLRKTKIDELPQLLNWLKGDVAFFGPRPDFLESWDLAPRHVRDKILSVKPGLLSVASLYFHDEEKLLQGVEDRYRNYYTIVKPMKFHLDMFWIEHRGFLLNLALFWIALKIIIKSVFVHD